MVYMLIIYDNADWARVTQAQKDESMKRHAELADDLKKAGKYLGRHKEVAVS